MAEKPKDHRPTHGWSQVEKLRKMEEAVKKIPDPYTVPEGYVPPTMKELWQYVSALFVLETFRACQPVMHRRCPACNVPPNALFVL